MFAKFVMESLLNVIENFPSKHAFCINENFHTYEQLGEEISKIRIALGELKTASPYIGLVVNDDVETYASILAIWMEGLAFVPLHPKQPFERNVEIIEQMDIQTILDTSAASLYSAYTLIKTHELKFEKKFLSIDKGADDDGIAYILFTSGSTGKPKGVMIKRRNVGAFLDSFWDTGLEINSSDRCLQTFDLTFDVGLQAFIAPLTRGACVYTVPHDQIKYSYVFGLFEDHEITFSVVAPSMLRYLKPYFDEVDLPKMKYCIVTAEASPLDLILEWQECVPNAQICNFYGPTEATVYCTYYKVAKGEHRNLNGMLSIGRPLKNVDVIIIDETDERVEKGEKGELCIAGQQVTPGYWNDPVKNEHSFFTMDSNGIQTRYYRSGDLCFLDESENLMLYGRLDSQVKIQGYRVEIGEIEYHARTFLNGNNVCVLTSINSSGNTELVMFLESEKSPEGLKDYLKGKLPSYMVPVRFYNEPVFPLNVNSKIDKVKLKEKIALLNG